MQRMLMADTHRQKPSCEIETTLSDGRPVCLRTIRPSDEARIRNGIADMSDRSRYSRFFSAFREPPESIVKRLSAVDHIGWGAILLDGKEYPPIAAAHAIRSDDDPSLGELAIAVLDDYQGLGLARTLIAALLVDCADQEIACLEIQVLADNRPAKKLVTELGATRTAALDSVTHYTLDVSSTLSRMQNSQHPGSIADVMAALRTTVR
jgi:ribosomal protein S18 acetylase RimI-like enzyme